MSTISQIAQFLRWRDWGPGKLTLLWSLCLYIAVTYELSFQSFVTTFLVFLVFAASQSAMGYVINDWGDRELDRKQLKRNAFAGMSQLEGMLALALVVVAAFLSGLPLSLRPGFLMLWLAWAAAAAAYSLEPIRLKTKGIVGLLVSFVAQWSLPVLIAFSAFRVSGRADMWLIALALTITGATLEVGHQRYDRAKDMLTRAETFAAGLSGRTIDRIYAVFLLLDKLAVGVLVAVVVFSLERIPEVWATPLAIVLAASYALLFLLTLRGAVDSIRTGEVEDPYFSSERSSGKLLHETLLNFVVPVILGIAATLRGPLYGAILGLFLVWRIVLGGADWLWPLRALRMRLARLPIRYK